MSWLSELCKSISKWWKKNNSIGDAIRNNEDHVEQNVRMLVGLAWQKKGNAEEMAKHCANQLLDGVLQPLPDIAEVIIDAMLEPRIASFFKSAFTIKDIKTPEQAAEYVMRKLKALK